MLDTVSAVNKSRIVHAAVHRGAGCKSRFKDRLDSKESARSSCGTREREAGGAWLEPPASGGEWRRLHRPLQRHLCVAPRAMPHDPRESSAPIFVTTAGSKNASTFFLSLFFLLLSCSILFFFFFPRSFAVSFLGV